MACISCIKQDVSSRNNILNYKAEKLNQTYKEQYIQDPDSAEVIAYQLIAIYDSLHNYQKKFYFYDQLTELYQFRKKNDVEALNTISKALEIFILHPDMSIDDPYFYINTANILNQYDLYENAIDLYKESFSKSKQNNNYYASALSYSNIAYVFQEMQQYDSASYYYRRALNEIPFPNDIVNARYINCLASVFLELGNKEIVTNLCKKSNLILCNFEKDSLNRKVIDSERYRIAFYEIKSVMFRIMAENDTSAKAYENYLSSLIFARKSGSTSKIGLAYFNLARENAKLNNLTKLELYADSAMQKAKNTLDFSFQNRISDFLKEYYSNGSSKRKYFFYSKLSEELKDSIKKNSFNDKILKNKIMLASTPILIKIRNLKILHEKNKRIILQQYLIIGLLILVILIWTYIVLQKRKLKTANKQIVKSTSKLIRLEEELSQSNAMHRSDKLFMKLEKLMKEEKAYIDSGITLSILSNKLDTNQTYLSQLINKYYGVNFNDYINEQRIKELLKYLNDDNYKKYKIDYLAEIVGFKVSSTFYNAFKKYTGLTPSAFKNLNLEMMKKDKNHNLSE
ncbi:MAG: helix-turn-helix domain-containing protein [Bacteroidales bacterium]